jgi:hypothetical protein
MYGTLTKERYDMMKSNYNWRTAVVQVCEVCYLDLTANENVSALNKMKTIKMFWQQGKGGNEYINEIYHKNGKKGGFGTVGIVGEMGKS